MKESDHLSTYGKMGEAADFYLYEAFLHADRAFEYQLSSYYFSELLNKIDPSLEDREVAAKTNYSSNTVEFLRSGLDDPLTEETLNKIHIAWQVAQENAMKNSHHFEAKTEINNIFLLGHVNNLGFFLETLVNRHLLFLNMDKKLNDFSYKTLERAQILNRTIYIFKEEFDAGKLHLDKISRLTKLRNSAVHYTPENANSFKVTLEELLSIWKQLASILESMHNRELFNEIGYHERLNLNVIEFKKRWQAKKYYAHN